MIPQKKFEPAIPDIQNQIQKECSFDGAGFVRISDLKDSEVQLESNRLRQWLDAGNHADLKFLERNKDFAFDPRKLFPNTNTVFVFTWNYRVERKKNESPSGKISQYAHGRDYHKSFLKQLQKASKSLKLAYPNETFSAFTDSNPVHERFFARKAGLGFIGRHTLLITSGEGSYVFIGLIFSSLNIDVESCQTPPEIHGACPRSCRKCIDICPTGALKEQGFLDAGLCISYLTIEYQGIIEKDLSSKMGDWLFGCDLCQDVCPFVLRARISKHPDQTKPIAGSEIELAKILAIKNHDELVAAYAGSPLIRAGRENIVRNALIIIENLKLIELIDLVKQLIIDESPVIVFHAKRAHTFLLAVRGGVNYS